MPPGTVARAAIYVRSPAPYPAPVRRRDFQANEFGRKLIKPISLSFRISVFNDNVFTFHVSKLAHALPERLDSFGVHIGRRD
jgi:hypothetical protein